MNKIRNLFFYHTILSFTILCVFGNDSPDSTKKCHTDFKLHDMIGPHSPIISEII